MIIGRSLTDRTREALSNESSKVFIRPKNQEKSNKGYTLAQKMVGKACGVEGIRPGTYCEPRLSTVGSQDTTGPMTRDELKELACLAECDVPKGLYESFSLPDEVFNGNKAQDFIDQFFSLYGMFRSRYAPEIYTGGEYYSENDF